MRFLVSAGVLMLTGCGGGDSGGLPSQPKTCDRVVSIQVAPQQPLLKGVSNDQLPAGVSAQYEATLTYCDGSTKVTKDGVKWSVSNANAAISASGMVSTIAVGSVQIIASLDNLVGERTLDISGDTLTGLTVSPPSASIPKGLTQNYTAQGTYSDGTTLDVTNLVAWSTSSPAVASINVAGIATGVTEGSTTVTAMLNGQNASAHLNVTAAVLTGLTVTPPNASIPKGLTQNYTAQGTYSDGTKLDVTNLVAWSSSSPAVASINAAGIATGVTIGSTTVTAMLNGQNASANLNVTAAALTGLTVTPPNASIPKGLTQSYTAQGTYSDGSTLDVTNLVAWSSSSPAVASINVAGIATGVTEGSTTVTAMLNGQNASANLNVTAAVLTGLTVTPPNASIPKGLTQSYTAQGTYSDGTTLDVTSLVAWSSSSPTVASISAAGVATGVTVGSTTVTALLDSISASGSLTVTNQGTVVTWGDISTGGDSSAVQALLTNVQSIFSNGSAFAALKQDGTVVTWGDTDNGGDSSAVQAQLTNVQTIFSHGSLNNAFAALKQDGTVVTWGEPTAGGDSSAVQAQLTNVQTIFANANAFAALKQDGTVVTWGQAGSGGDSSAVQAQLTNVQTIFANTNTFAALKQDGTVVTWGVPGTGGDSSVVQAQLTNVQSIFTNTSAYAALKQDGTVVTWGDPSTGSDSSAVQPQLTNVQTIFANGSAFAALKQDGTVVTWGDPAAGGDSSAVQPQLTNVQNIFSQSDNSSFAALKQDGTVVTWGDPGTGGDSSAVQAQLTNVQSIFTNTSAYAALKQDGTVVTWGQSLNGGDSSAVQAQLTNVQTIVPTGPAFAALKQDGSVVTWGAANGGGDSSAVQSQLTNVQTIISNGALFVGAFAALIGP
ncbi:Ig-like domain-containing protein [Aeromonas dhakensis]|uniref:Ig-like domain-containing protein n=1 Tax=Aeromonas dhakensis TaxID=196024 RepID=UPI0038D17779